MRRIACTSWLLATLTLAGCGDPVERALQSDGLYVEDTVVGDGEPVRDGDYVVVDYVTSVWADGRKGAEVSRSKGRPYVFRVGRGAVVRGWDQGMLGMRAGGRRTLVIAPALAYGDTPPPRLPAGAPLLVEVDLLAVPRTQARDLVVGTGPEAAPDDYVKVEYTGWLYENGARTTRFGSSQDAGYPVVFALGSGMVNQGWDEGIAGMRVGGRRELIIPPEMGYGSRGTEGVPPGATLLYEVTLVDIPRVASRVLRQGIGDEAKVGDVLQVHYTGWLQDAAGGRGHRFDSSRDRNRPFDLRLGDDKVIPGWEIGLRGMKVGEQRELTIPPDLAYGSREMRGVKEVIPAGSTLIFEVELLSIGGPGRPGTPGGA